MNDTHLNQLRDKMHSWMGDHGEMIAEFNTGYEVLRVYKHDGEAVNNLPEYSVLRAFMIGGEPVVSGDARHVSADEAFAALEKFVRF